MALVRVEDCGKIGVIKDLSKANLPLGAWTDSSNIRFLDGYAQQFLGHGSAYGTPPVAPYHVLPVNVGSTRYWMYAGEKKLYVATIGSGSAVHTNLTRQTAGVDVDYAMVPNQITSTLLSGIPIINPGNLTDPPQQWNLDIGTRLKVLDNWPASTFCKSLRAYKTYLIALNVTKGGNNFPYMVKWSSPADPGGVPITWDPSDQTQDAGEYDLAESNGQIIDGLPLRDMFMIYKEDSIWRMTPSGNVFIFNFQKVLGTSGALNRNCIVEVDGFHFVLTGSDVIVHDGQSATPVLDKVARRALFQDMDVSAIDRAFVFKNPFLNEVFVCYPQIGSSVPNKAMVWNYRDRTVSYRDIPNLHHANYGAVDAGLGDTWAADSDTWKSDITKWNGPDFTPNTTRVLMASADQRLLLLDSSASYDGVKPTCYVERVGLSFGAPEKIKTVCGIRLRATGSEGDTVVVRIGASDDPYMPPVYEAAMTHTVGESVALDCFVSGRYIAIRIESGSAYFARVDAFDIDIIISGDW